MTKGALRIAMLGHKRVPSREGGIEIVVEELGARMCQRGNHVVCYNRRGNHVSGKKYNEQELKHWKGMELKQVFTIDRAGVAAVTASISATLRAAFGRYDVVHFHACGSCILMWLPRLLGKRCICTIHGLDHLRKKWQNSFGKYYIRFSEWVAVRFANEMIVLNESEQKYFQERYGRRTIWIPNGVSRKERRAPKHILNSFGLEKDGYILFLGRIVPEKGIEYLIDAFRRLHTDKKLVIAGGSSDSFVYFRQLKIHASCDENILFTDFVQGEMLDELYSNAYVYVLPSDLEGMPLSLLEAMSYGNCCVVSDIPGCAEIVGDHGLLFERGNVRALQGLLQRLCDHPEIVQKYREASSDYVVNRFSWEDVTDRTLAVYRGEEQA